MNLHICKRISFFSSKNPSFLGKPHFSLSHTLLFSSSTENKAETSPPLFDLLLHKHQFSPEAASQVASALSQVKNLKGSDSMLTFLKESGFSKNQLEKIVTLRPGFLSGSLNKTIKPKIKIFLDLGFDASDIAEIFSKDPFIFHRSADNRFIPALSMLKSLLGSSAEVAKVLKTSDWFLKNDLQKKMVPNIEFLKSCGVGMEQIIKHIYNFPRLFFQSPENMKKFVKTVDEMGLSRSSRMFIHVVRAVSSMSDENWELKLKLFKDLGFSEDDILEMFSTDPQVFAISEGKLKKVIEVLVATGKYDVSCIARRPNTFIGSVEKRLKPRIQVLTILENKSLLGKWPPLSTLYQISDMYFYKRFVKAFLNQVGELYMLESSLTDKRNRKLISSA